MSLVLKAFQQGLDRWIAQRVEERRHILMS